MKFVSQLTAFVITCSVLYGCSQEGAPEPVSGWMGEWVNKENPEDIILIDREIIKRVDLVHGGFNHRYNYKISGDSISLKYTGINYIYLPEMTFKYTLNTEENQFEIKSMHTYFPEYEGDVFVRKDTR